MPVVVVGTEKTFTALRPRVAEGKLTTSAAAELKKAVAEANPHANLNKLTPGTVLTIPETKGVRTRGDLSLDDATKGAVAGAAESGRRALGELAEAAKSADAAARAERRRVLKLLDGATEAAAAVRRTEPGLTQEVRAARAALEAEDEQAQARAAALKQAQSEWAGGLDALAELMR